MWVDNPLDPYSGGTREFILRDVNVSSEVENFFQLSHAEKYIDPSGSTVLDFTGYWLFHALLNRIYILYIKLIFCLKSLSNREIFVTSCNVHVTYDLLHFFVK